MAHRLTYLGHFRRGGNLRSLQAHFILAKRVELASCVDCEADREACKNLRKSDTFRASYLSKPARCTLTAQLSILIIACREDLAPVVECQAMPVASRDLYNVL
eukprot:CAMPEP_0170476020 /NCGR_PEP_ID=MMETSP0123-20130129/17560_1 /TAXON_ID=182087 /ORGANISM="Favella ehrenbergii, Strain Fehren 1" /LENGTH=102 /DNA_ID=CAMNT_0010746891 /DNA_START=508 /DNA_END=816 /DNA_ORIENTATION=+